MQNLENESLNDTLADKINNYLDEVDTKNLSNFYDIYMSEIEPPLFKAVLEKSKYNQVRAAKILGISRGTLRKKLKFYFGVKHTI